MLHDKVLEVISQWKLSGCYRQSCAKISFHKLYLFLLIYGPFLCNQVICWAILRNSPSSNFWNFQQIRGILYVKITCLLRTMIYFIVSWKVLSSAPAHLRYFKNIVSLLILMYRECEVGTNLTYLFIHIANTVSRYSVEKYFCNMEFIKSRSLNRKKVLTSFDFGYHTTSSITKKMTLIRDGKKLLQEDKLISNKWKRHKYSKLIIPNVHFNQALIHIKKFKWRLCTYEIFTCSFYASFFFQLFVN